jgi:hypothetical protein
MIVQERVTELLEYRDGDLFWKRRMSGSAGKGDIAGCVRKDGYRVVRIDGKLYLAHRLVWLIHHGCIPPMLDHINMDRTNNRIENLREASNAENMCNSLARSTNTSGVKGVSWFKPIKKWAAVIGIPGKSIHLGYFNDISEAEQAMRTAREKYHGAFCNHG